MRRRDALLSFAALSLPACRRRAGGGIAQRVVSISASTTEALFAIGAGPQTVGRSRFCDFPREALALPVVGGYVDPSLEAVLALRPDLVVGARGPLGSGFARTLEERGIATWFPETERIEQIFEMLSGLGTRTGHVDASNALVGRLRAQAAMIVTKLAARPRRRVFLMFSKRPITSAGPGSFPDEMLQLAGAINVVPKGATYPTLALEQVVAYDPDVVLDAEMGGADAPMPTTHAAIRAVAAGRVVRITDEAVLRPGPRVLDGVVVLARAIHGADAV